MTTIHLIIQGKVQGVFFRVSARKKAVETNITGWVKNTPERHVEIIASGNDEQIKSFIEWCKNGPSSARVDNLIMKEMEEMHFDEFKIFR
jgi:acylphosphatase